MKVCTFHQKHLQGLQKALRSTSSVVGMGKEGVGGTFPWDVFVLLLSFLEDREINPGCKQALQAPSILQGAANGRKAGGERQSR